MSKNTNNGGTDFVSLGLFIGIIYFIFGGALKRLLPNLLGSSADRSENTASLGISNIVVISSNLSHPLSSYNLWANELFNNMEGCGTSEAEVTYIFATHLRTNDDVRQLVKSYGTKTITCGWGAFGTYTGALPGTIRSEMNSTYLDTRLRNAGF